MLTKLLSTKTLEKLTITWPDLTSTDLAAMVLALILVVLVAAERRAPKLNWSKKALRQSYQANFSLFIFNSLIMSALSITSLLTLAKAHLLGPGLLGHALDNPAGKAILSILALDLMLYLWHRTCHSFDSLWLFHRVHHNDPALNVSTGLRVHITELLLTHLLKGLVIIAMGIDELIVWLNEIMTTVFVMVHHSNISFKGEKWLGLLLITPRLHRTHHSTQRSEHDSNYGAMLSVWDRLLGTLNEKEASTIGIKGRSPQDFFNLVKFGFTTQAPAPASLMPDNLEAMIAEAAYYKAEKRDFRPGHDLADWLEAKKEIMQMFYIEPKARQSVA
jgi:sterol desaturase/sphingolipid hydroxylase (fatty acid hydroxylase superfamily)